MSYSSLYGIKKNYTGEKLYEYKNSCLFAPIVMKVLPDKYISHEIATPYGFKKSIFGLGGNKIWEKTNRKINDCDNTPDRICWELSNQQIFFTKDKQCIAYSIQKFVEQNKKYCKSDEDNLFLLEREHIIERFTEIADDILGIDKNKYPYFVIKNTSTDDSVENWFEYFDEDKDEYVDKSLKDCNEFLAEFVIIENNKISKFVSNLEYQYK